MSRFQQFYMQINYLFIPNRFENRRNDIQKCNKFIIKYLKKKPIHNLFETCLVSGFVKQIFAIFKLWILDTSWIFCFVFIFIMILTFYRYCSLFWMGLPNRLCVNEFIFRKHKYIQHFSTIFIFFIFGI
jgi:hypothetical protein